MVEFPSENWKDYALLDSGNGLKLERFGSYVLSRPEPKALWTPSMSEGQWRQLCHTSFTPGAGFGKAGKEDSGVWNRHKKMDDQWYIGYSNPDGLKMNLRLGLTSFKHVGLFPEQAPNWDFIFRKAAGAAGPLQEPFPKIYRALQGTCHPGRAKEGADLRFGEPENFRERLPETEDCPAARAKVLNLFAYTGAASLAAKAAGADVTHLDSVRQVVSWARGNMEHSGLDGIHWVVEDALRFAHREQKRGNVYDGIILDPPAYGHGPDGQKWKLDECLFEMLRTLSSILAPHGWVVLNLYSNGFSAALGETIVREAFHLGKDSKMESGELALQDSFGKALPLSIVVRLEL